MRSVGLALVAACGSSSTPSTTTTPSETRSGEEVVTEAPVVAADEDPRALFAAQCAALESHDAAGFVHDFAPDAVFLGPVGDAVYIGHDAIESALGNVVDASGSIGVTVEERHFADHAALAWSVHDVSIQPAEVPEGAPASMRYRVSSVYRRVEGWSLAAQAWGVIVPNAEYAALNARAASPAAIEARDDDACESASAELTAWLGGDGTMWRDNADVFAAGIDPAELHETTEHLGRAGDSAVRAGEGGSRAHALGDDVCVLFVNQVVENLPYRMLTVFVADALRLAHVVAIVPDAPSEPDSDADADADSDSDADADADADSDSE